MNLATLLFGVARRLPDRRAVMDDRQSWNYGELAERVAQVAGGLRAYGLVPGDRVLLSLENCGEFFELLFGCWAAGGSVRNFVRRLGMMGAKEPRNAATQRAPYF
jgi:acyl-CoA synthetase (AMP-forming)/AMP-acid ligase II